MPCWKIGVQLNVEIGIGGKGVEISHRETICAMKGEFHGIALGSIWDRSLVKATGWLRLIVLGCCTSGRFLLPAGRFLNELGSEGIGTMIFSLAGVFVLFIFHSLRYVGGRGSLLVDRLGQGS